MRYGSGQMTLDEYLEQRGAALARFARVLCGHREIAEDVLQEVLLRAHGQWERIASMDYPEAYLRRMIVNEHLRWRRRTSRQTLVSEVESLATVADPAVHSGSQAQVGALLAELPRRQRAAVVLRY
jgi:DNA-directed RNA polymerase specialized sigma24 family protein